MVISRVGPWDTSMPDEQYHYKPIQCDTSICSSMCVYNLATFSTPAHYFPTDLYHLLLSPTHPNPKKPTILSSTLRHCSQGPMLALPTHPVRSTWQRQTPSYRGLHPTCIWDYADELEFGVIFYLAKIKNISRGDGP